MLKSRSGKYESIPFSEKVNFWGVAYVPSEKYLILEFHPYYFKLEWGYKNV